jgi:hypothetical protein
MAGDRAESNTFKSATDAVGGIFASLMKAWNGSPPESSNAAASQAVAQHFDSGDNGAFGINMNA